MSYERLAALNDHSLCNFVLTHLSDEIIVADPHTLQIIYTNDAILTHLGMSYEEVIGRELSFVLKNFTSHDKANLFACLQENTSYESIARLTREDGSSYKCKQRYYIHNGPDRDWLVVISDDLSEIEVAKEESQAILDTTVDAIININHCGEVQLFNRAAEKMFGYNKTEIIGRNISLLMPQNDSQKHDQYLAKYLSTGERKIIGVGREVVALRKDGTEFPIELSVAELTVGKEKRYTGILRDISERKEAESKIRQREDELKKLRDQLAHIDRLHIVDEMTTGIAHELNQPLTAIANYAKASQRLLKASDPNLTEVIEVNEKINRQTQRAGEVVHRLRALVKKDHINYQTVSPSSFIKDALALLQADSNIGQVDISTTVECGDALVEVDAIQIGQVITNLIKNAIDALTEIRNHDNKIQITVDADDNRVFFSVRDNGMGISAENKDKIFEPFFTSKRSGMGMGLCICRSIIKSHGGDLNFKPVEPHGVDFCFSLPIANRK